MLFIYVFVLKILKNKTRVIEMELITFIKVSEKLIRF